MLRIGDFSKLSRVSIRMLRHYSELGLLIPASVDESTGYRYYNENQLPLAQRIQTLKDMGFKLSMIGTILEHYGDAPELEKFLLVKQKELEEQARMTQHQLQLLANAIKWLRKDGELMSYNVTLKTIPERYVASLRQVIPAYDCEGTLWHLMNKEIAHMNVQLASPCCTLAVFYDEGYKECDVDVEVQMSVEGKYEDTEHVKFKTTPPVQIASATYKGGYDQITRVNEAVANWIRDNGYAFSGNSFNIYHVSPHETSNPEELVTEVCYPVKRADGQ